MAAASGQSGWDKLVANVGLAFKFTVDKTSEGINHLKAPPKEIECVNCPYVILIPPELFDWSCGSCGASNSWDKSACSTCSAVKAADPAGKKAPTIACTMCQAVNEVPANNAMKNMIQAGRTTKKLAVKAAEATKEVYQEHTSIPKMFACEHCGTEIQNPNYREVKAEEDKSAEEVMNVSSMTCETCKQATAVPSMAIANSFRVLGASISKGSSKAFYSVAGNPYAECPTCKNPCGLPPKPKTEVQPAVATTSTVTVTCGKCSGTFTTTY
eukprot:TRINITY_DN1008_c0_g1_i1.p1 TRINITY_DN1008_c0_g1~~TRINITY_DN1008_c0_g1_i1.p1  ORF type:complete len:270 (-),score=78.24 TRINITY_DN1008_c0_g1_i1:29-838(-)